MLRIVRVILFRFPQASLLQRLKIPRSRYALRNLYSGIFRGCIVVYLSRFNQGYCPERRRRDLNPRAAINDLHPFQGCPFDHLGTSPKSSIIQTYEIMQENLSFSQRREWDSNPRALADKRFSRPPRYDHFDISPKCPASSAAKVIISKMPLDVNHFFMIFLSSKAPLQLPCPRGSLLSCLYRLPRPFLPCNPSTALRCSHRPLRTTYPRHFETSDMRQR